MLRITSSVPGDALYSLFSLVKISSGRTNPSSLSENTQNSSEENCKNNGMRNHFRNIGTNVENSIYELQQIQ